MSADLPIQATINGSTQTLAIKFEDDDLFDTKDLLAKVDFAVCPVVSAVDGLLGKLGSLELSPKNLLGQVETAGCRPKSYSISGPSMEYWKVRQIIHVLV